MAKKDPISLEAARQRNLRRQLADRVLKDLGAPNAEELAAITESAPTDIRDAIIDGLHRHEAYKAIGRHHAELDEQEGIPGDRCCNAVCLHYKQSVAVTDAKDGSESLVGRRNYCSDGVDRAQGCIFRMTEYPPSDPFTRIPSWAEAVRMLMRNDLLEPDDFGQYNGTDFAQRENTHKLWWAYVDLLQESGKIPRYFLENSDVEDRGKASDDALVTLRLPRRTKW